jgi:serine/threonine protein kinase
MYTHSYLVLEFVDKGDLFEFINWQGRLREEEAIYYFRQMMSAIQYCHSLNICHRDLKPENILLNSEGQVKIADFGMAALHQSPTHHLRTACGSPHYAAPELLKQRMYKGESADIWSMGVILFAMLAGRLPFDDPQIHVMLSKAKKGDYQMPSYLSTEAKDFIYRILQVEPHHRISMAQMWKHALIRKYDYLDELNDNGGQPPDIRRDTRLTPQNEADIDPQILRQLRSVWHAFTEQELKTKLTNDRYNSSSPAIEHVPLANPVPYNP